LHGLLASGFEFGFVMTCALATFNTTL